MFSGVLSAAYVDQSHSLLPADTDTTYGFAAADLVGGSEPEILVLNQGRNKILQIDGSGNYSELVGYLPDSAASSLAAEIVDVDDDGDADLVLANADGTNALWLNDGTGQFASAPDGQMPNDDEASMSLVAVDLDGDSHPDLVVANYLGQNRVLINDGSGQFADETGARIPVDADPTFDLVVADLNGDGSPDIFFANRGVQNRLLVNNGLGQFTDETAALLPVATLPTNSAAVVDVDGDGAPDLLLADGPNGLRLLLNDGSGVFFDGTATNLPTPAYAGFCVSVQTTDIEPDGSPDILAVFGDSTRLLANDGSGVFSDETETMVPADLRRGFGLLALDIDGDLDEDAFVATPGDQNRLLVNEVSIPRIRIAITPDYIELSDSVTIDVQVYDEDGISSTEVTVTPEGLAPVSVPLAGGSATYATANLGVHTVTVTAEDTSTNTGVRTAQFEVVPADSTPPALSIGVDSTSVLLGEAVGITVTATDAGSGVDSIDLWVNGTPVPVDNVGNASFTTSSTSPDPHEVTASATDRAGNPGAATPVTFTVQPDPVAPTVDSVDAIPDPVDINNPVAIEITASDNVAVSTVTAKVTGPDTPAQGVAIELVLGGNPQNRTAAGSYTPTLPGIYSILATATDPSGTADTADPPPTFVAEGTPDTEVPVVTLTVAPHSVAIGGSIALNVSATDNVGVIQTILEINGSPVPLDAVGDATYTPPHPGTYSVLARAYDDQGNIGEATDVLQAVHPGSDIEPPVIEVDSPIADAEIAGSVDIIGTITDDTLASYKLEVAPQTDGVFSQFASGTLEVLDDVLGTLDTSGFTEGFYEVRVVATDVNGATATETIQYLYVDNIKLGRFTLEYEDFRLPAMGIDVVVRRTYDSARDEGRDFGPGWRLSFVDMDLREDERGNVYVTLPNGRRTAFSLKPRSIPFFPLWEVAYEAPPGIYDSLETPDCDTMVLSGGQWFCDLTGGPFNPDNYRLTTKEGMIYDISQSEGVRRIEDRNGNYVEIQNTDTGSGIVTRITSNTGRELVFTRDDQDRIVSIEDPVGGYFTYEYDTEGRLTRTIDQAGYLTDYTYHGTSHLIDDLLPESGCFPIKYFYDADGRVFEKLDAAGNSTLFSYDDDEGTETVTNGRGNATTYRYDATGRTVQVDDAMGTSSFIVYDATGNKIETVDPSGKTTTFTYDGRGNELSRTHEPEPGVFLTYRSEYNSYGQVVRFEEPEGNWTEKTYDVDGNMSRRESFDSGNNSVAVETFTYDAQGNMLTRVDQEGETTTYTYNAFGDRLTETDPTGVVSTYEYDANGNRSAFVDGVGNRSEFVFDGRNMVTSMTHEGEATPRYQISYSDLSEIATVTDANGVLTTYDYDCLGNLTGVVYPHDADGEEITYGYDETSNLDSVLDANTNETTYRYDAANRLTARTGPDTGEWGFGYSPDGTLNRLTTPKPTAITHSLDGMNRPVERVEPERTLTLDFDGNSRLTAVVDDTGVGSMVYGHDALGRVLTATDVSGRTVTYTRNARGDVATIQTPDSDGSGTSTTTSYTYDAAGRVERVATDGHWVEYSYDLAGRRNRIDYSNGIFTLLGYDSMGYLTSVETKTASNALVASYDYIVDRNGNRTAVEIENGTIVGDHSYSLDDLYRLTSEQLDMAPAETWQYDAVGNRLDTNATFGPDNRLLTHGDLTFTHDHNGNITGVTDIGTTFTESFDFDSSNRLTQYDRSLGGTTETSAAYEYDYLGRRTARTVDGDTIEYLYSDQNVVAEYDGFGNLIARYSNGPELDELLMMKRGSETYFFHLDGMGSVVAITDDTGTVVRRYGYDAWGNITANLEEIVGAPENSRTYVGRELDAETGLYHMRARAYDAGLGRFLQKDPEQGSLKLPQSQHLYAYAKNNPINLADRTGRTALVSYTLTLAIPSGQEVAAAMAGFLQGFGTTNIQFIAEYLELVSGVHTSDLGALWDTAVENTRLAMEDLKGTLGYANNAADYAGVASIPSAFIGGVTFELGFEVSIVTGDSYGESFKAEGGGFVRGVDQGLSYLRALRPR